MYCLLNKLSIQTFWMQSSKRFEKETLIRILQCAGRGGGMFHKPPLTDQTTPNIATGAIAPQSGFGATPTNLHPADILATHSEVHLPDGGTLAPESENYHREHPVSIATLSPSAQMFPIQ